MISIVVPTIAGREHHLQRCEQAYLATMTQDFELIIVEDEPTCNRAWNIGIERAQYPYIHLSADDLEPHPGWAERALEAMAEQYIPCPRILNADGSLQSCGSTENEAATGTPSDVARVPFFPRVLLDVIYPILDTQYMGDYWVTTQARKAGWPTLVVREMVFTHHMAEEGRLDSMDSDIKAFQKATK